MAPPLQIKTTGNGLPWSSACESTKNRNRKSPRFSVANVPVASQTTVGTFFSSKNRKKNHKRLRLLVARKSLWGGKKTLLGPKNRCDFFTCVSKSQSQWQKSRDTWCSGRPAYITNSKHENCKCHLGLIHSKRLQEGKCNLWVTNPRDLLTRRR